LAGTRYDWLRKLAKIEPKDRKEFAELEERTEDGARLGTEEDGHGAILLRLRAAGEETSPVVARMSGAESAATTD
jgi:hypothetical protein